MLVRAQVKANQRKDNVFWTGNELLIYVSAPAQEGKANQRVVELLADTFDCAKSLVRITKGRTSPRKTIELDISKLKYETKLLQIEKVPQQLNLLQ